MKRDTLTLFAVAVLVAGVLVFGRFPPEAQALDKELGWLEGGAALTECGTTATKINLQTSSKTPRAVLLIPESGGTVYVGGSGVTTTAGVSVCSSGCDKTEFAYDGQGFYCIASGSAVDVKLVWSP